MIEAILVKIPRKTGIKLTKFWENQLSFSQIWVKLVENDLKFE